MALSDENTFIKAYQELEQAANGLKPEGKDYPILEVVIGPNPGIWFSLNQPGDITLGRANINAILLEDNSVSRSHAILRFQNGMVTVRDIGSRNGTYVNQKKILSETSLSHLDTVKAGIYTLRLLQSPVEHTYEEPAVEEEKTPHPKIVEPEKTELETPPETQSPEVPGDTAAFVAEPGSEAELPVPAEVGTIATQPKRGSGVAWLLGFLVIVLAGVAIYQYRGPIVAKVNRLLTSPHKETKPIKNQVHVVKTEPPPVTDKKVSVLIEASSQPVPARVYYEGKELGTTPFQVSILANIKAPTQFTAEYLLEEIGETVKEKKTVQFNAQDELAKVEFGTLLGAIKLDALPKNGNLYLEGAFEYENFQPKPLKVQNVAFGKPIYVPLGKYVVELRELQSVSGTAGTLPRIKYRREFVLNNQNREYVLNVKDEELASFPATLTSEPSGAAVLIDGKKVGETPFKGNLPLGQHKLTLRKEGFEDKTDTLNMDVNIPYSANFTLGTTPAGNYVNLGRNAINKGQYNQAIEHLIEALKRNPDKQELGQIHYLLGKSFLKTQNYEQAQGYFEKAIADKAYAHQAELGLAEVYSATGQAGQALAKIVNVVLNTTDEKVKSQAATLYNRLYPIKSAVYIATEPSGAQITINGNPIGQPTPLILSDLMVGTYRVQANKDGYKPIEIRFNLEISSIKPVIIKLEPLQ